MAFKGEIFIVGKDGKEIPGPRENKTSLVFEFNHEVYLPFDTDTGTVQGNRRISAFTIVKEVDKLTPTLYQFCVEGTLLDKVVIILYKIEELTETPYFNYTLEKTNIISIKDYMPSTKIKENEQIGQLEEVKFNADYFTWNFEPDSEGKGGGSVSYMAKPFGEEKL